MCRHMGVCVHAHMPVDICTCERLQRSGAPDPLGLEWHQVVSCSVWALGMEYRSSDRAVCSHSWATSLVPKTGTF